MYSQAKVKEAYDHKFSYKLFFFCHDYIIFIIIFNGINIIFKELIYFHLNKAIKINILYKIAEEKNCTILRSPIDLYANHH